MDELKWTDGTKCERSNRRQESNPIGEALREGPMPEGLTTHNKRELSNNKILERGMMSQTSQNPFLNRNDYLQDLNIQETFLRPKNSNFDIETKNN